MSIKRWLPLDTLRVSSGLETTPNGRLLDLEGTLCLPTVYLFHDYSVDSGACELWFPVCVAWRFVVCGFSDFQWFVVLFSFHWVQRPWPYHGVYRCVFCLCLPQRLPSPLRVAKAQGLLVTKFESCSREILAHPKPSTSTLNQVSRRVFVL